MMKYRLVLLLSVCSILSLQVSEALPKAEKGIIDLRNIDNKDDFILRLNGEWEFYWNELLHPHDFKKSESKPDIYGKVPSYWNKYSNQGVKTEAKGYASYRLIILLPQGYRESLGFDMPVFNSSYNLYINGEYYAGNGFPGKSAEETKPEYRKNLIKFDPASDTIDVLINVSNYSHHRGGFWLPLKFGTYEHVRKHFARVWAAEWVNVSVLLNFSFIFLVFFILYPKEKAMAYLSMATIGLALRPFFTSHFLINDIVTMGWVWIVKFQHIILYVIIAGWTWFIYTIYPTKYFRLFARLIGIYFIISFFLTLFIPANIITYNTFLLHPPVILILIYVFVKNFQGILKKNTLDIIYFLAFLLLIAGAVHDIRITMGQSESHFGYTMSYCVLLFVFIQATALFYKWVRSYYEKEKLRIELEYINKNLELLVSERTETIQRQKKEIEMQNKQLTDTLQLKNKIFSVVAHDLRSPIVNILYMLNLLKEKEYHEKFDTLANSSIEYAKLVISLLENMLVWGRGQEDRIRYSPARLNIADIILTNMSIVKESADKKEISVNFTQMGSSMAYVDKDLLDIIIRNLLSNAVKYTPRRGMISILLKEEKSGKKEHILLKICDNGVGIPLEKQKKLFTSTEIISTPGTENEKGTGLGLKLCYELVQINKGTISVDSKEGEGTCFSIILPGQAVS